MKRLSLVEPNQQMVNSAIRTTQQVLQPSAANAVLKAGADVNADPQWRLIDDLGDDLGMASKLLSSGALTDQAALEVTLGAATQYRAIRFLLATWVPATDGVVLYARTSTDGGNNYASNASDYAYTNGLFEPTVGEYVAYNSTGAAQLSISASVGSAAGEAVCADIVLHKPTGTSTGKLTWSAVHNYTDGTVFVLAGGGQRNASADIDAVQLFFSGSSNISSGTYAVYGLA